MKPLTHRLWWNKCCRDDAPLGRHEVVGADGVLGGHELKVVARILQLNRQFDVVLLQRELSCRKLQGVPCARRLGFVDLDFKCSTVCPTLLGLMEIWQMQLCSWARWWNTEIKFNPTQVYQNMGRQSHPVEASFGKQRTLEESPKPT